MILQLIAILLVNLITRTQCKFSWRLNIKSRNVLVAALVTASTTTITTSILNVEEASALGVKDGLLEVCVDSPAHLPICTSSQDDRPQFFLSPWMYDEADYTLIKKRLVNFMKNSDVCGKNSALIVDADRYLRYSIIDSSNMNIIDDLEFYFTPNDNTIQFRSGRRSLNEKQKEKLSIITDFGTNYQRIEKIRIGLSLESVPVLRNRKQLFLFGDSPFDSFGPPTIMLEEKLE